MRACRPVRRTGSASFGRLRCRPRVPVRSVALRRPTPSTTPCTGDWCHSLDAMWDHANRLSISTGTSIREAVNEFDPGIGTRDANPRLRLQLCSSTHQCGSSGSDLIPEPGERSGRRQVSSRPSRASRRGDRHRRLGGRSHPPMRRSGRRIGPLGQPSVDEIRWACHESRKVLSPRRAGRRLSGQVGHRDGH